MQIKIADNNMNIAACATMFGMNKLKSEVISAATPNQNTRKPTVMASNTKLNPATINHICQATIFKSSIFNIIIIPRLT